MKLYAVKKYVKARNIREALKKSYDNEFVQNMEITMEKDLLELRKQLEKESQIKVDKPKKSKPIGF